MNLLAKSKLSIQLPTISEPAIRNKRVLRKERFRTQNKHLPKY
tara:strand:- start:382 stop:510 length:129 start_codon:yes stop_codon:yes gene_type:complete